MTPRLTRVLYVEDDPDVQAVGRLSLEAIGGFTVETCDSGRQAIRVAPAFAPDLILLDVMMPDLDGVTTLAALREFPGTATIPVVFMTARVQPQEIARYRRLGAAGVITKPFDPVTLPVSLREIWDRHQA